MLDDIELPQVQEITSYDRRAVTEHKPPGRAGSLVQNLGRRPLQVVLWGVVTGPDALAFAQRLDDKFRAGQPVPFTGDIVADAKLDLVLIEDLKVQELAGKPQRLSYLLTLREYLKAVDPRPAPEIDGDLLADALNRIKDVAEGIALVRGLATGLEPFVEQFTDLLGQLQNIPTK